MGSVLVTGAGTGIGRGIAEGLAAHGWQVAVNDIDEVRADEVAGAIGGSSVPGDVTKHAEGIVARAIGCVGPLSGLVNNAGALRGVPLAQVRQDDLDAVYELNLRAPILLSAAALDSLCHSGGAIVNLSSISYLSPQTFGGLYAATKSGLSSFTAQAAVEWGRLGVRVNAVAPGMTWTTMTDHIYADDARRQQREELVPLRRIGTPADIADVVRFLLGPDSRYVTGQTLVVDGGYTRTLVHSLPVSTVEGDLHERS